MADNFEAQVDEVNADDETVDGAASRESYERPRVAQVRRVMAAGGHKV